MANSGKQDVDVGRRATLGGLAAGGVVLATGGARGGAFRLGGGHLAQCAQGPSRIGRRRA